MDSARATVVFGAAYALRGLVDAMGTGATRRNALLALVIVTTIATIAFWFGSRGRSYRWFAPATAGFVSCFLLLGLLEFSLGLPRVLIGATMMVAPAAISYGCARILASPGLRVPSADADN